jgi:hypothetical protein
MEADGLELSDLAERTYARMLVRSGGVPTENWRLSPTFVHFCQH